MPIIKYPSSKPCPCKSLQKNKLLFYSPRLAAHRPDPVKYRHGTATRPLRHAGMNSGAAVGSLGHDRAGGSRVMTQLDDGVPSRGDVWLQILAIS